MAEQRTKAFAGKLRSLRRGFATRIVAVGIVITVVLVASISSFLLVSRAQQTRIAAESNAINRAHVARQLLQRVTAPLTDVAANAVVRTPGLAAALQAANPGSALSDMFAQGRIPLLPGASLVVLDARAAVLFTSECDQTGQVHVPTATCLARPGNHLDGGLETVRLLEQQAADPSTTEAAGVELSGGKDPVYDVAVVVRDHAQFVGVVVYSAGFATQMQRLGPAVGYTPSFIPADAERIIRFNGGAAVDGGPSAELVSAVRAHGQRSMPEFVAQLDYDVPGAGQVAGAYVPIAAPRDGELAGYLGVEVKLADFSGQTGSDEFYIVMLGATAVVVVALVLLVFAQRYIRRPLRLLERSVAGIAAGDYSHDIAVASDDELGRLTKSVNVMRAEIEEREGRLREMALHDSLTGLPNRRLFTDLLKQELATARRDQRRVAVFAMDLNRFKDVNDTMGHDHGDLLIQQVAERLRSSLREGDTVARFGGDEFAILAPGLDREHASQFAARLDILLGHPYVLEGLPCPCEGGSIGFSVAPDQAQTAEELLKRADAAMYVAKESKRAARKEERSTP